MTFNALTYFNFLLIGHLIYQNFYDAFLIALIYLVFKVFRSPIHQLELNYFKIRVFLEFNAQSAQKLNQHLEKYWRRLDIRSGREKSGVRILDGSAPLHSAVGHEQDMIWLPPLRRGTHASYSLARVSGSLASS